MEPDSRGSLTPEAAVFESKVFDISDKIGLPRPVTCDLSSLSVVVAFFTIESIPEYKFVAENEVEIAKTIDHLRRIRERGKPGCLASLSIEVLMPSV
jgi:hypothetical protein